MHRADRIFGILFLAFGIYLIISSREFAYWQDFGPGSGYFPFWLGAILILLSAILLVQAFFFHKEKEKGFGFFWFVRESRQTKRPQPRCGKTTNLWFEPVTPILLEFCTAVRSQPLPFLLT